MKWLNKQYTPWYLEFYSTNINPLAKVICIKKKVPGKSENANIIFPLYPTMNKFIRSFLKS